MGIITRRIRKEDGRLPRYVGKNYPSTNLAEMLYCKSSKQGSKKEMQMNHGSNPRHMVKLYTESVDLFVTLLNHKNAKASLFLRAVKRARRRYKVLYSLYANDRLSFSDLFDCQAHGKYAEKHVNVSIFDTL